MFAVNRTCFLSWHVEVGEVSTLSYSICVNISSFSRVWVDSVELRLAMCHHVFVVFPNCSPQTFVCDQSTFVLNVLTSIFRIFSQGSPSCGVAS